MALQIGKTDMTKLLTEKYKKLSKSGWITLIKIPPENHLAANIESIRILKGIGYSGIYLALTKGYDEMLKILKDNKISASELFFIDAVSKLYGEKRNEAKNCIFISGPLNIDAISTAIYNTIPSIKTEKKFVILDSMSAVLIYNNIGRTMRFSKFLTETLKKMQVDGILVTIAEGQENEKLFSELSKLADEVIDLGGGNKTG